MKRDEIYRKIRQDIISGVRKEGEKLPTEPECAAIFGVSRDTVRDALKHLEQDGFVERVKAKGTFIKLPKVDTEDRNISYLVPCYEYLRCTAVHQMNLLFELIAQAAVAGWRITPVIYSKTNDPHDIWWENLQHFNPDSRVIVDHHWFQPYFETLHTIGARTAYIDNDWSQPEQICFYTKHWLNFIEMDRLAAKKSFAYLKAQGCRKIAVFMSNPDHPSMTIADEYRKFAEKNGQELLLYRTPRMEEDDPSVLDVPARVSELYKQGRMDGLLIHTNEFRLPMRGTFRASLGLPEDFPLVAIPSRTDQIYNAVNDKITIVHYPVAEMAKDMIHYLTAPQYNAKTFYYKPELQLNGQTIPIP